jgi:hypothetical protein
MDKIIRLRAKVLLRLFQGPGMPTGPLISGSRPICKFGSIMTSGQILLEPDLKIWPGEEQLVIIHFIPEYAKDLVQVGAKFTIHEGIKEIGNGEIISLQD